MKHRIPAIVMMRKHSVNRNKVSGGKRIRVLIIDGSAVVRRTLTDIVNSHPSLEVVGTAADPLIARDKIKLLRPDVLTLDVEMPRMDGYQFLKNLMRLRPMPVVMISSLTAEGTTAAARALELGAVDFLCKPTEVGAHGLEKFGSVVCGKLLSAAATRIDRTPVRNASITASQIGGKRYPQAKRLLAFGASTGGTLAITDVIRVLPADSPGVVIVQHIPVSFSGAFANNLNHQSALRVAEAVDGEIILQGHAYVAPGDKHLEVVKEGSSLRCRLSDHDPVCGHKPSVDVLFNSVARAAPESSMGIILTGMGKDGAEGLLRMHNCGAKTIAQDEQSSVVWGMPGAAVSLGAASKVLPLCDIGRQICVQNALKPIS